MKVIFFLLQYYYVYLLQFLVTHQYREEILNNCPSEVHNWATFQHYNFQVFKNKNKNIIL